jgi:Protein of unknown function (DUF2975)
MSAGEVTSTVAPARDPLGPIRTGIGWLTGLVIVGAILDLLFAQQPALGQGPVCVPVSADPLMTLPSGNIASSLGVARGSYVLGNSAVTVCADHPGGALRVAGMLMSLPTLVLFLGFLVLIRRLLTAASRPGALYSLDTARRLRFLGWYLTAGAAAAGIIETIAKYVAIADQTSLYITDLIPSGFHLSVSTLLVGLGLISVARVMRIGVTMREDLDGTV